MLFFVCVFTTHLCVHPPLESTIKIVGDDKPTGARRSPTFLLKRGQTKKGRNSPGTYFFSAAGGASFFASDFDAPPVRRSAVGAAIFSLSSLREMTRFITKASFVVS